MASALPGHSLAPAAPSRPYTHRRTVSDMAPYTHRRTFSDDVSSLSDDEEDLLGDSETTSAAPPPDLSGCLSKWTNFIHGWQDRYVILKNGTLSYYKSEAEIHMGCRGAIHIQKATIKPHQFDLCRFEVSLNDSVWYLRAVSTEDRDRWIDALEAHKRDSGYSSESSLRRQGSALSVQSLTSTSSFQRGSRGLREKLAELETYREILLRQVDTLQHYFDDCADAADRAFVASAVSSADSDKSSEVSSLTPTKRQHAAVGVDFRGEAVTFKATTAGVISSLGYCIEVMRQREESWRKRVESEKEKRRRLDDLYRETVRVGGPVLVVGGPDYEEGPGCTIKEEEFFDAVETGLDRMEEEEDFKKALKFQTQPSVVSTAMESHPLFPVIRDTTAQQLSYANAGVEQGVWELFVEDGPMKLYKRDEVIDGLVCDPLKAEHFVKGVTAKEMIHYFFAPEVRMEWEFTVESMNVLEQISEDCMIFYQLHKRIWPAAQRDSLYWSYRKCIEPQTTYLVCNKSCQHDSAPVSDANKVVRVDLEVCMLCSTKIEPGADPTDRSKVSCQVTYCSRVNPGGWLPVSALRQVYKREYPRFLSTFTAYVYDKVKDQPVDL
ncbi:unnamed protein product [Cyprideis torosa]|uniref:Uncharacterized protein n=1 Tax=Cyprideis torosa TaxID=163714 RepID=A0A7R8WBS7_9CRUS|nr:unnamed protein product [Cyprideis torosa]CAG0892625.1 unnamed protein product [Cyprideis torosa]